MSRATESYITITSSHINNERKLENSVLQTHSMGESHTAENICETLQAAVEEWELPTKCRHPPVVLDNAANMLKATDLFVHTVCVMFAHTLNFEVQKALKAKRVSHVLARVWWIVAFFHRSTFAANLLKSKAELLNIPPQKLKIDVVTRWNSAYDMIVHYLEVQVAFLTVLRSKELAKMKSQENLDTLSDADISLCEELGDCLRCESHHNNAVFRKIPNSVAHIATPIRSYTK